MDDKHDSVDDIIKGLKTNTYDNLGEQLRNSNEEYYTNFKLEFLKNINNDANDKYELIKSSYGVSLQLLFNGLQELEHAYKIVLSINNIMNDLNMVFDDNMTVDTMIITDKFITNIVDNIKPEMSEELIELLLKYKEQEND